jgi:predicted O-methyltransferase YrrM
VMPAREQHGPQARAGLRDFRYAMELRKSGVTYLSPGKLMDLAVAVRDADRRGLVGAVAEAGTARGGSAAVLARAASGRRHLHLYDTFGLIPAPSERDDEAVHERYEAIISGDAVGPQGSDYYGYDPSLKQKVEALVRTSSPAGSTLTLSLHEGDFTQTMEIAEPLVVGHIDCDWYDSVMVCLERMWPQLVPGGVLIIDDYVAWAGCTKAVDDFLATRSDCVTVQRSGLWIRKL